MSLGTVGLIISSIATAWLIWLAVRMERIYRRELRLLRRAEAEGRAMLRQLETEERERVGIQARVLFRRRDWGQA